MMVVWLWIPVCLKLSFSRRYSFQFDGREVVFRKLPYFLECKTSFFHKIWFLSMCGRLKLCTERQTKWLWTIPCPVTPRPSLPNYHVRYELVRDITWQRMVICYLCFVTTHQHHRQRWRNPQERTEHNRKLTDTVFFSGETWSII